MTAEAAPAAVSAATSSAGSIRVLLAFPLLLLRLSTCSGDLAATAALAAGLAPPLTAGCLPLPLLLQRLRLCIGDPAVKAAAAKPAPSADRDL